MLIAAHTGAGGAADLGVAQLQHPLPGGLGFPSGHDHARIRNRDADNGHDLGEGIIVNGVAEGLGIDIVRRTDTGHADGVGTYSHTGLQMLRVHEQPHEIVAVHVEPEEHAAAHIIDAALHGPVHGLRMIGIVMLGSRGMELFIIFLMIGLLEQNVGANARLLQPAVVLHRGGGNVHIHPADGAVLVLDGINGLDALQDVLDGIVHRILAGLQCQPLVAHILQGDDLPADLLLGQLLAADGMVPLMIGAVDAAVHAVIGQVQRRKKHDALSVELLLDLPGQPVHPLIEIRQVAFQQHRRLPMAQALAVLRLFQYRGDELPIAFVFGRIFQGIQYLPIVDEFLRPGGFRIIFCHICISFGFEKTTYSVNSHVEQLFMERIY